MIYLFSFMLKLQDEVKINSGVQLIIFQEQRTILETLIQLCYLYLIHIAQI